MKLMMMRATLMALLGLRLAEDSGDEVKKFEARLQAATVVFLFLLVGLWLLSDWQAEGTRGEFRPGYLQRF